VRALLGIWHDDLALLLMERPEQPLELSIGRLGCGRGELIVTIGEGSHATVHTAERLECCDYPYIVRTPREPDDGFARCSLMRIDLGQAGLNRSAMRALLPPDHEFPWPRARDCDAYLRAEELMRDCLLRKDSATRHKARMPAPPANIQRLMTPEMRVALFS